jgi:hypothetical protein
VLFFLNEKNVSTQSKKVENLSFPSGKGTRYFNPLEDYRFFHHWFSGVKAP